MNGRDEWTGTAGELWEALNGLVGEAIRHTKAWPGAPNTLSARMKRLAPALRGIGVEYGEDRGGSKGTRRKTLTKKVPSRDRQHRQHRQSGKKTAKESRIRADGPGEADDGAVSADNAGAEDRQEENPIDKGNRGMAADADGTDDESRPDSGVADLLADPPAWYGRQAAHCARDEAPERLLKPLAAAVAHEVYGDTDRWSEVLPRVEASLREGRAK
jgi:hypothetical protein